MNKMVEQNKDRKYANQSKGFSSDNRYRKARDLKYNEMENELQEDNGEKEVNKEKENNEDKSQQNVVNHNWEKRYSDVRSYASKLENDLREKEAKIKELETQPVTYPTTEEEIQEWATQYPKLFAVFQTISMKQNDATKQELNKEFEAIKKQREEVEKYKSYMKLLELQPDFEELKQKEDFKEWFGDQPRQIQDAILRPTYDDVGVKAASRVIDLYKLEKGISKKPSREDNQKDVARNPTRTVNNTPGEDNDKTPKFTESQINRMSTQEFARLKPLIIEAQRKGPPYFIHDVSGGAR